MVSSYLKASIECMNTLFLTLVSSSAIIEHVRDGSVVRALLLPDYYLVTVMLSGVKVSLFDRTMTIGYVVVCMVKCYILL